MPAYIEDLAARVDALPWAIALAFIRRCRDELAIEVASDELLEVARMLRDDPQLSFELLMDLAGVDYLDYGRDEWRTNSRHRHRIQPRRESHRAAHARRQQALRGGVAAAVAHIQPAAAAACLVPRTSRIRWSIR